MQVLTAWIDKKNIYIDIYIILCYPTDTLPKPMWLSIPVVKTFPCGILQNVYVDKGVQHACIILMEYPSENGFIEP